MHRNKLTNFIIDGAIEREDWTFADDDSQYMTHGFHSYPARMMPLIAKTLIKMYSKSAEEICIDPFCGSGTVLVEAKLAGIPAKGIDANPLAVLIAQVKTTPIHHSILQRAATSFMANVMRDIQSKCKAEIPNIKNLDFWFKPEVSNILAIIRQNIFLVEDQRIRDFFKACFSITVRKVSNNRPGEFKLYSRSEEDLKRFKPDVIKTLSFVLKRNIKKMDEFCNAVHNDSTVQVVKGDTRNLLNYSEFQEDSASLLITSPPYGDSHTTVAYGQYSRYLSLWLGYNEKEVMQVDRNGLGGRIFEKMSDLGSPILVDTIEQIEKVDKENKMRAKETYAFFEDMDTCFSQISKVMKDKSHICYVLGNRTVKRIRLPSDKILIELGQKYGFRHIKTIERGIPNKYMPAVNSPENMSTMLGETMSKENIIIWEY